MIKATKHRGLGIKSLLAVLILATGVGCKSEGEAESFSNGEEIIDVPAGISDPETEIETPTKADPNFGDPSSDLVEDEFENDGTQDLDAVLEDSELQEDLEEELESIRKEITQKDAGEKKNIENQDHEIDDDLDEDNSLAAKDPKENSENIGEDQHLSTIDARIQKLKLRREKLKIRKTFLKRKLIVRIQKIKELNAFLKSKREEKKELREVTKELKNKRLELKKDGGDYVALKKEINQKIKDIRKYEIAPINKDMETGRRIKNRLKKRLKKLRKRVHTLNKRLKKIRKRIHHQRNERGALES